jgi:hypothetical protein
MLSKKIAAALLAAAMCTSSMTAQFPTFASFSVSAETVTDIPQDYRTACDWIWKNRIETERSCEAWSTIYDQIIAGNGTLQYILIWQSYEKITLAQRQKLSKMLEEAINKWNDCLVGYDDWPIDHVNVKVVGYAVLDESCILDRQPDEVVYTQTTSSWLHDDMISSGMGNSSVPNIQPAEPVDISRYVHWNDKNWSYQGSYDNRYDMYLHGITGMIDMGGYGYHYGQILSDKSVLGLIDGTTSQHILLHEMGHGFGFPDYYGGEGESDGFPPGGFPGGEGSIMMAGSCGYINTFDKYFARYTWSKIKDEPGRFDLKSIQPIADTTSTAEFTDEITAIDLNTNGYSSVTFKNNGTYRFPAEGYFDSDSKNLAFYEVGDKVSVKFTYNTADNEIKNIEKLDLIVDSTPAYPEITNIEYSDKFHQIRFSWKPVSGATNYGIAVYLAGKWRIQTQNISASSTSYTTPKNMTPGKTYKVAVAAKVNGTWGVSEAIKHAVSVTVK